MTQEQYIQILCDELGFDPKLRNAYLTSVCGRQIHNIDEMLTEEQHIVISDLRNRRDRNSHLIGED